LFIGLSRRSRRAERFRPFPASRPTRWAATAAGTIVSVLALWSLWTGCRMTGPSGPVTLTTIPGDTQAIPLDRNYRVRVGIATGRDNLELAVEAPCSMQAGSSVLDVRAGSRLRFEPLDTYPAEVVYHVIVETVRDSGEYALESAVQKWTDRGYDVDVLCRGTVLRAETGIVLDGRMQLVSVARFATEQAARDLEHAIEQDGTSCWIGPEVTRPASGTIELTLDDRADDASAVRYEIESPLELESAAPISVEAIDFGFWDSKVQDTTFGGTLEIAIDPSGMLELIEVTTLDEYLRGVVPAEMPSSWPSAALEAQAVCARSETLSRLGVRHMGDDFDICATEHCQAYRGTSWHTPATDNAVRRTAGRVMMSGPRLLEAVYSHNCGGHTEDNDAVWTAPPDMALRGVPDAGPHALEGMSLRNEADLRTWLAKGTAAFCSHLKPENKKHFRWRVRHTAREVDEMVAAKYPEVGRIRDIRAVERGVSGRLKTLKIVGRGATVVVHRELPIRRLFGGLYSANFVLDITRAPDGMPASFEFIGGGHGHGVGMCQDGARYLAASGRDYEYILRHYFEKAAVVRLYE